MTLAEGTVLRDRYRVEGVLGEGGMGVVYAARQIDLDRPVAIKVLSLGDAEFLERFRREIRILASLSHPNVIQIIDHYAGDATTPPFLVMERLVGRTLSDAVRDDGPMPEARVVEIGLQLTDAMSAAHAKGIVHRDIKPGNVFLTETTLGRDAIKLLDFGVARDLHVKDDLTREGAVVGTLAWLSPEQLDGQPADVSTDVYAVGATLFFCLFGRRPFPQGTIGELAHAIATGKRDSANELRPHVAVARVIERSMARDRTRRYATAAALAEALEDCLERHPRGEDEAPASAAPTRIEGRVEGVQRGRKHPWRRRVAAIAALVVVLLIGLRIGLRKNEAPSAPPPAVAPIAASGTPVMSAQSVASPSVTQAESPPSALPSRSTAAASSAPRRRARGRGGAVEVWVTFDCDGGEGDELSHVVAQLEGPAMRARVDACDAKFAPPGDYRHLKFLVEPGGRVASVVEELDGDQPAAPLFAACVHRAVVDLVTFRCPVSTPGYVGMDLFR